MCGRESGVRFRAALKAFLPPARASQAGLKKISTFRFSSGSIFFAQPLHGEPRFVFTAQLSVTGAQAKALAPHPLPCSRVNCMCFKKAFRRQLGRSLGAASRLGVLHNCSLLHLFMERHNTTPLHPNPSRQPLVLKRAARRGGRLVFFPAIKYCYCKFNRFRLR